MHDTPLHQLNFVIMDLETTGFGHADGIVEIACVRFEQWEPVDQYHSLVNPEIEIPGMASRVHGIHPDMVEQAPTFGQLAPTLAHFLQDAAIVGHNFFSFDLRFLTSHLREAFGSGPDHVVIDTLPLARQLLECPSHKLEDLAPQMGIPLTDAHQAMSDVYATAELWLRLFDMLSQRGARTLEDLGRFKALRELDGSGLPRFDAPPPRVEMPR